MLKSKILPVLVLFLAPWLLYSQGTVLLTEAGKQVLLNLDEVRIVRPTTSGSIILYSTALRAVYVSETPAQVAGLACGQIALINTVDVGRNVVVGVGVRWIDAVRKTSDNKAQIYMTSSSIPVMKTVESFDNVVLQLAICSTGPGGNNTSAGGDQDSIVAAVYVPATGKLSIINEAGDSVHVTIQNQTLSISGNNLSISNGNTVSLAWWNNLPYYVSDSAAMAAGLNPGDPYLLECDNDYTLPAGIFKVVKICAYDCFIVIKFYTDEAEAMSNSVPIGKEFSLNDDNPYGLFRGFIVVVTNDTLNSGTLSCNDTLDVYANDSLAIVSGLAIGDHYNTSDNNLYGAPTGMERVVCTASTTEADPQVCCDANDNLPFFDNDAAAISGGLVVGEKYYLTASNTYGWKYGSKKTIQ